MRKSYCLSKVLVLTIAICLWWGLLESARGESKPIFETLKTRYLKLRNTDNQIGKPKEWRGLAGEFLAAVKRYPKDSSAASAILNASIMYEELFRAEGTLCRLAFVEGREQEDDNDEKNDPEGQLLENTVHN